MGKRADQRCFQLVSRILMFCAPNQPLAFPGLKLHDTFSGKVKMCSVEGKRKSRQQATCQVSLVDPIVLQSTGSCEQNASAAFDFSEQTLVFSRG